MLRTLNFESALNICSVDDGSADVRDRAKTALANMNPSGADHAIDRDVEMRNLDGC